MAVDHNNPQSRDEEILIAMIDGEEYDKIPQSRIEELLLELKEVIEEGGGGGTSDYENLSNQPQVNGETLIGDKSGADLGLVDAEEGKGLSTNDYDDTEKAAVAAATSAISAMKDGSDIDSFGDVEVALLDKQDELTAGKYIQFTNDEISVKRDIAYEADEVLFAEQTNEGLHVTVTVGSTTLYEETLVTSDSEHTVLDLVQTRFSFRDVRWILTYLKASKTSSAGDEAVVWPSVTDTFVTTVDADKKLIIQSELDDAINSAVSKCYHHAGTKTCAELLPALLIAANEGNVYEITDSGTTTSDFMEGIGHPIKEGDNIGVARVSEGVYKFDLLSGFVDTSNFVQKSSTAGLIMNDGTIDTVAKQPATDNNLTTTDKTTTGAINELKSGLTNLDNEVNGDAVEYPYADVITIEDAIPANVADCSVKIEPVQDLHGFDHPWVGGAGKNKLPLVLADIKTANTDGTWNGNVYSINGGTITVNTDSDGNVVSINANGTFSAVISFILWTKAGTPYPFESTSYTMNGCRGGSGSTYKQDVFYRKSGVDNVLLTALNGDATADFSVLNDETVSVVATRIVIYAGTLTNQMFYPMLRLSTETDATFAPYTNYCPISGHTEVVITDTKPNLYVEGTAQIKVASNWTTDNTVSASVATDLTVSGNNVIGTSSGYRWIHVPMHFEKGRTYHIRPTATSRISNGIGARVVGITDTYTPSETFDGFVDYGLNAGTYTNFKIGISTLDNYDINDYNKKSPYYTIALGDTIYGGTVDFDTGVMTVTHGKKALNAFSSWGYDQSHHYMFATASDAKTPISNDVKTNINSDSYNTETANTLINESVDYGMALSSAGYLVVSDARYTDVAAYLTDMGSSELCYELATPFTVQLTRQQIQLLKGQNTLTASTGDISVTVNGVSGSIGAVQEQVNELSENVGGANLKILKYTGTGTTSYTLDFGDDTPATIMQIIPEPGESVITNNYEYLSGFAWGVPFTYGIWANKSNNLPSNHGGFNISTIAYNNNTCTITGASASAAANYEGQKYAVYYLT